MKYKTLLIVLDGFGIAPPTESNSIYMAHPKTISGLFMAYPHSQLRASGQWVGLPDDESGNTEVGHTNLGAGKIVYQSLPRINMSIADGTFNHNPAFLKAIEHVKKNNSSLHLLGLIGEQHVHANIQHLFALLRLAKDNGLSKVFIHPITDGRDSPPQAAQQYLSELEAKITELGIGTIATIMGRYYGMDRDKRWSRIEKAYDCLTQETANPSTRWQDVLKTSYEKKITDEFIEPTIVCQQSRIQDNDAVIFYNFRIDRPRELTRAFTLPDFETNGNTSDYDPYATKYFKKHIADTENTGEALFQRKKVLKNLCFVTMTEYQRNLPVEIAFPPHIVANPLGKVISEHEMSQLRVAESEKERFVTFYFNGLREPAFPREERIIIPSPKVATYDLKPEMSAVEVADTVVKRMNEGKYDFILVNFANADMLGHTGNQEAIIKAIQTLDTCLEKIVQATLRTGFLTLVTADHGNAEEHINTDTGGVSTEHTNNPVPFLAIHEKLRGHAIQLQSGILADVAPTILQCMGLKKPSEMTGRFLLEEVKTQLE